MINKRYMKFTRRSVVTSMRRSLIFLLKRAKQLLSALAYHEYGIEKAAMSSLSTEKLIQLISEANLDDSYGDKNAENLSWAREVGESFISIGGTIVKDSVMLAAMQTGYLAAKEEMNSLKTE